MSIHHTISTVRTTGRKGAGALLAALLLAATVVFVPAGPADAAASPIRVTSGGDMIVTGTNGRDDITVFQEGPESYRIEFNHSTDYYADGVTRNVTFNMRGGDDLIYIEGAVDFPKNVTIKWGSGDSLLHPWANDVEVGGNLTVIDGNGQTTLNLHGVRVFGKTRLTLGNGEAAVSIKESRFFDHFTAAISSTGEYRQFRVSGTTFDKKFTVNGGNKPEVIEVAGGWFADQAKFNLRGGDDELLLSERPLIDGRTTIDMGQGNDNVTIDHATVTGPITVRTGGGNDSVDLTQNTFAGRSIFDGGSGTDQLFGQVNDFDQDPKILRFE